MKMHCMECPVCAGLADHWHGLHVQTEQSASHPVPPPQLIELVRCETTGKHYYLVIGVECLCGPRAAGLCDECLEYGKLAYQVMSHQSDAFAVYYETLLWQERRRALLKRRSRMNGAAA